MKFYIPKFNLPKIEKLVRKLRRKAPELTFEVFPETERQTHITIDGKDYPYTEIEIELDIDYKVGNYELVAQIEHTPEGNIIRNINLEKEVPERYRTTNCYCDHCHTNRERKNTFLLVDNNGDYKQVGKSCLNDYTGYDTLSVAEAASSLYRIYKYAENQDFENDPEFMEFLKSQKNYLQPMKYMANLFYQLLLDKGYNKNDPFEGLDEYEYKANLEPKVDELLNVVNTDWYDDRNDYCHNCKVVTNLEYIEPKHHKILMSYLFSAMKYLDKLQQRQNSNNEYLGNVGDKIEFTITTLRVLFSSWNSYGWGSNGSESYTYRFTTENGNVVLWTTSKVMDEDFIGCRVVGTIKALKEYKGEKQTVITRAKVDETMVQQNKQRKQEEEQRRKEEQEIQNRQEAERKRQEKEKDDWILNYCNEHNLPFWLEDSWEEGERAYEQHIRQEGNE